MSQAARPYTDDNTVPVTDSQATFCYGDANFVLARARAGRPVTELGDRQIGGRIETPFRRTSQRTIPAAGGSPLGPRDSLGPRVGEPLPTKSQLANSSTSRKRRFVERF